MTDIRAMRDRLSNVRWIGGPPDAGKSTVTRLLAERFEVPIYRHDGRELAHFRKATPETHPYTAATWHLINEQGEDAFIQSWVDTEPEALARDARANWSERVDFYCEDLLEIDNTGPVVAEGPGFFPDVISPLLTTAEQAIWLIPSESFKRQAHEARGKSNRGRRTSDPDRFREHHIARDLILADQYRREVDAAGLPWIEIDGTEDAEAIARRVAAHFGLG